MVDLTQGGITVTISGSPTTGTWMTNGHWVVAGGGTITVTGHTPTPTGSGVTRRHGAMVNPVSLQEQGYDGRMDNGPYEQAYSAALDVSLSYPITLSAGDCLVVSKSGNLATTDLDAQANAQMLDEIFVLHVLASAPASPSTTFRPPYAGTVRTQFTTADIVGTLPNHTAPFDPVASGVFEFQMDSGTWLDRPHYHLRKCAERPENRMVPRTQQEFYPAYRCKVVTALAALSCTDHARKIEARNRVIQNGIDLWGCVKATMVSGKNGIYSSGAGYGNGFHFPILYAGYMLGNAEMLSYLDLKWINHGGAWHYDTDFDVTHPCVNGDGDPIDYMGEVVGCFWEYHTAWYSPDAWSGYNLPRSRDAYVDGFPLWGGPRSGSGIGQNDASRDQNGQYNSIAYQATGYTTGLSSAAGWGEYMHLAMPAFAGNFIVARLMGIEGYYRSAMREMAYWWLSDNQLWPQAPIGNIYLEDVYAYGGTGNSFVRSLWIDHGSIGAYISDGGAAPDPVAWNPITGTTLTVSVTV